MTNGKPPLGTTRKTGEKCPESGRWDGKNSAAQTSAPVLKGDTLPPYKNLSATWTLIQYI